MGAGGGPTTVGRGVAGVGDDQAGRSIACGAPRPSARHTEGNGYLSQSSQHRLIAPSSWRTTSRLPSC